MQTIVLSSLPPVRAIDSRGSRQDSIPRQKKEPLAGESAIQTGRAVPSNFPP